MNQLGPSLHPTNTTPHPMHLVAAAAITLLALVGTAKLAGWLPTGTAIQPAASPAATLAAPAAPPATAAPAPASKPEAVPHASTRRHATASRDAVARVEQNQGIAVPPAPTPAISNAEPLRHAAQTMPPICSECGVVQSVNEVQVEPKASGGGAIAGGIVGGIIGNQIGKGATRDIATILGAAGGAYAGNHIEKSTKESKRYDVVVRFEDGSTRSFSGETPPVWMVGDRVRLQNGVLTSGGGSSSAVRGTI